LLALNTTSVHSRAPRCLRGQLSRLTVSGQSATYFPRSPFTGLEYYWSVVLMATPSVRQMLSHCGVSRVILHEVSAKTTSANSASLDRHCQKLHGQKAEEHLTNLMTG